MNWQFWKSENRASVDYTSAILDAAIIAARGQGTSGESARTAAVVFGIGVLSRAFAVAEVTPPIPVLTPEVLSRIMRSLSYTGNCIFAIDVSPVRGLSLIPTSSWDISGDVRPETWTYMVDLPAPSGMIRTRSIGAEGVIHCRQNQSLAEPWRGQSPLSEAGLSASLLGNLEKRMNEEASGQSGYLLPIPEGLSPAASDRLRSDLGALEGKIKIVETTTGAFGQGRGNSPLADWRPQRLGMDIPQFNVELRRDAASDVLSALGVPSSLMTGAGGTAIRESYRHVLTTTLTPLGKMVSDELSAKLERDISITFPSLNVVDIAQRARAYHVLIQAEMDPVKAETLSGLATA